MSALRAWTLAAAVQVLAAGGMWWLADAAYGGARQIVEGAEEILVPLLLVLLGPVAGAIAVIGIYRLHRDQPIGRALVFTLMFVPPLLLAAMGTGAALVITGFA